MAIQRGLITLSGKMDDQIYFRRDGKNLARSAPAEVQISESSKKSGTEFGRASKAASVVRRAFLSIVGHIADRAFNQRLRSSFVKVINSAYCKPKGEREVTDGDLALLKGFQINRYTPLQNIFSIEPRIEINPDTAISITFPKFRLEGIVTAPPEAVFLVVQLGCSVGDFSENGLSARIRVLQIDLRRPYFPTSKLVVPDGAVDDQALLIAIGVHFLTAQGIRIGNRNWMAGRIIESGLVSDGQIVPFVKQEKKIDPVVQDDGKQWLSWDVNDWECDEMDE
ncbi:MAG: hypothetical protein V4539_09840 [Bacteroidota bacterium]